MSVRVRDWKGAGRNTSLSGIMNNELLSPTNTVGQAPLTASHQEQSTAPPKDKTGSYSQPTPLKLENMGWIWTFQLWENHVYSLFSYELFSCRVYWDLIYVICHISMA